MSKWEGKRVAEGLIPLPSHLCGGSCLVAILVEGVPSICLRLALDPSAPPALAPASPRLPPSLSSIPLLCPPASHPYPPPFTFLQNSAFSPLAPHTHACRSQLSVNPAVSPPASIAWSAAVRQQPVGGKCTFTWKLEIMSFDGASAIAPLLHPCQLPAPLMPSSPGNILLHCKTAGSWFPFTPVHIFPTPPRLTSSDPVSAPDPFRPVVKPPPLSPTSLVVEFSDDGPRA